MTQIPISSVSEKSRSTLEKRVPDNMKVTKDTMHAGVDAYKKVIAEQIVEHQLGVAGDGGGEGGGDLGQFGCRGEKQQPYQAFCNLGALGELVGIDRKPGAGDPHAGAGDGENHQIYRQ